ncbi:MAG: hypothetical protein JF592_18445 [Microbacterium sp.]|uniref:hypothetical protein n=1 Tax=Microbacterium sp. TaxID=51671 RepID=UPI001D28E1C6|nr:hypothetical protein [Microbacterium sp.]MBW8764529.1 hypothetical protein [Microbacterium sp.]
MFFVVFFAVFFVGTAFSAQQAYGAAATGVVDAAEPLPCVADQSCEQTSVSDPGDLIPMPDMAGEGQKTLFESYPFSVWFFDSELTAPQDLLPIAMNGVINFLGYIWQIVVYAAIGLTWWLFGSLDVPGLADASNAVIAGSAATAMKWLFPTSIIVGGAVAYVQHRQASGSALGQIGWMTIAGVLATGLMLSPAVFTGAVNEVRTVGSNLILSVGNAGVASDNSVPFEMPEPDYSGNTPQDEMLRKSADTLWRALVATPWCLAEFGSIEGCQKYGLLMLNAGADTEARKDIILNTIYPTEANNPGCRQGCAEGYNSPLGSWVRGANWGPRLGMTVFGLIIALVMCIFMVILGFSALGGVVLSFFLLIVGVFFAALWCIPGRTRRWGVQWFEALIGSVMTTFVAFVTFSAVTALLTAAYAASMTAQIPGTDVKGLGWLGTMGIGLVIVIVAFSFRKQLAGIVGATDTNIGRSALIGAFVARKMFRGGAASIANGTRSMFRAGRSTAGAVSGGVRSTAGGVKGVTEARRRALPGQQMSRYYARAATQGARYVNEGGRVSDVRQSMHASRSRGEARQRVQNAQERDRERNTPQFRRSAGGGIPMGGGSGTAPRGGGNAPRGGNAPQRPGTSRPTQGQRFQGQMSAPKLSEGERVRHTYRHAPAERTNRGTPQRSPESRGQKRRR